MNVFRWKMASPESFSPCSMNDTMAAYELPLLSGINFPAKPLPPNHSWGYVLAPATKVMSALKGLYGEKGGKGEKGDKGEGKGAGAQKGGMGNAEDSEVMTAPVCVKDPAPVQAIWSPTAVSAPPVIEVLPAKAPPPAAPVSAPAAPACAPTAPACAPPKCPAARTKPPPTYLDQT